MQWDAKNGLRLDPSCLNRPLQHWQGFWEPWWFRKAAERKPFVVNFCCPTRHAPKKNCFTFQLKFDNLTVCSLQDITHRDCNQSTALLQGLLTLMRSLAAAPTRRRNAIGPCAIQCLLHISQSKKSKISKLKWRKSVEQLLQPLPQRCTVH